MKKDSYRIPVLSETNALSFKVEEKREKGENFIDLTVSNPTKVGLSYPIEEITKIVGYAKFFPYEPSPKGLFEARKRVVDIISDGGKKLNPDQIWLTASTSEAYSFLFKLLADPLDEILVPTPSYPLLEHLLSMEGIQAVKYPLQYVDGWWIDLNSLESKMTQHTKAIVVVNPNNPTGNFLKPEQIEGLLSMSSQREIALISDEVFLAYSIEDKVRPASLIELSSSYLTFVLGGLSKQYGLPQIKLSWIYVDGHQELLKKVGKRLDWISDLYLSVNTVSQTILPSLIDVTSPMTALIRQRVAQNYQWLKKELLSSDQARVLVTEGGWSQILQLVGQIDDDLFCNSLLQDENVLVYPGYYFDISLSGSLVVSLLVEPSHFQEGIRSLLRHHRKV